MIAYAKSKGENLATFVAPCRPFRPEWEWRGKDGQPSMYGEIRSVCFGCHEAAEFALNLWDGIKNTTIDWTLRENVRARKDSRFWSGEADAEDEASGSDATLATNAPGESKSISPAPAWRESTSAIIALFVGVRLCKSGNGTALISMLPASRASDTGSDAQ